MQLKRSNRTRSIVIIVIVTLFVLSGGGLWYWLAMTGQTPKNTTVTPEQNSSQKTEQTNNVEKVTEPSQTDAKNSTYVPEKTPEQYDGQTETNNSANSIEYGNEQFRIPEGAE
jgi:cytoskeletal protein RodZ